MVVGCLLALAIAATPPSPAVGVDPTRRFTSVFLEKIGDVVQDKSAAETELLRLLLEAGVTLVDDDQAAKIRALADAKTLISGSIPRIVTSMEADFIIAAVATTSRVTGPVLGEKLIRYNTIIDARLIRVDTAQIVASMSARGGTLGLDPLQVSHDSAEIAARRLFEDLMKHVAPSKGAQRLELIVSGLPNVSAGDRLIAGVRTIAGVTAAKILNQSKLESKIFVETSTGSAHSLATALENRPELGLAIVGYSDRAIKAEYSTVRATQLSLTTEPLEQKAGDRRHAWEGRALSEMVSTALLGTGVVGPHRAAPPAQTIVLRGTYRSEPPLVHVSATLVGAGDRAIIAEAQKTCEESALAGCATELGIELGAALGKGLEQRRDLALPSAQKPLEIRKIAVDNIFPAQLSRYAAKPIGRAVLHNAGSQPLKNVVVTVELGGFPRATTIKTLGDLAAKADTEAPLALALDREAMIAQSDNRPTTLSVSVEYGLGEFRIKEVRAQAIIIYNRNAISWSEASSVASFVSPETDEIIRLARAWRGAIDAGTAARPIAIGVMLFEALGNLGLRYLPDPQPTGPFGKEVLDRVQYPIETLEIGTGDCDDLAVLYAAFAESIGVPTLLLTTPGHIFVAIPSGLPEQSAYLLSASKTDFVVHEGQLWVPLETTKVGRPFVEAWDSAVREIARWRGSKASFEMIDLRQAWRKFPPTNLAKAEKPIDPGKMEQLAAMVDTELKSIESRRKSALGSMLEGIDKKLGEAPQSNALTNEKAVVLAHLDRADEAKSLLRSLIAKAPASAATLNNLGDLAFRSGAPEEALALYKKALAASERSSSVPIHLNAALASLALGNDEGFGNHIVSCLELGAEAAVLDLARAGYALGAPHSRGASEPELEMREIGIATKRAFERAKREPPAELIVDDGSKSSGRERMPIGRYLFWLVGER